ncbi:ATP-grasp domain-containing protein [Pedobacter sp. MC2016-14]|uniref:ATP-grasp domain-containing protein n=1 Tax=Pedobacter sp. MC2016-14 TaxID=2897327 RepID=UPI001E2B8ACE|nr:ATP-grasp domain-containing protein [Pedobacter sp. MC2016-14]MCD0486903.1 ATP-grasp domain-containing protein [Pedobacter sp. MC2016-14]
MYNIAVTGVGGGVGQSILKSLEKSGYNVIALDGELLAAGLYAAGKSYLIPYANSPEYIDALLAICKAEKIALLFPGLDAELMPLSLNRDAFKAIGTTVVVSSPEVIKISDDKQETHNQLIAHGIDVPFTSPLQGFQPSAKDFPLIVKQQVGGARSKNVYLAKNEEQWGLLKSKVAGDEDSFIVMQYIEGDEYTCGTVNLDEQCKGVIVMRRILRDGDTHKCFSEKNPVIEKAVRKVVEAIKPFGACNVQLRMKDGIPYVFEINARCSGTTASRTLCGFNEPKMIADYLLQNIEPQFEIREQTILRYWQELVVENESVRKLKDSSKIQLHNHISL